MKIIPSKLYRPLFTETSKYRYIICMGGRASGRSYEASQFSLLNLISAEYFRCAIMRFILGDIRNSIFQEIYDRIEENEDDDEQELLKGDIKVTENNLKFEYGNNKIVGLGFRKSSGDQKSKLKSLANFNVIIIEEADEISEEDFQQLDDSLRTIKGDITVILLLNPPSKNHWIIKRWFNLVPAGVKGFYKAVLKSREKDTLYIHGTYLNNIQNINQKTIDRYERYKETNPEHYYTMIRGLVSEGAVGRVYKNWKIITDEEFDELPYDSFYALDFGFSNDPAFLGEIKVHNENIWVKELLYETGLTNVGKKGNSLSEKFEALGLNKGEDVIWADGAEPKSIKELKDDNWIVKPAPKGADSIRTGIDYLLSKQVYYTESSENIMTETQEYKWALDKDKNPTNKPIDDFNHAMDGIRYGVYGNSCKKFVGFA